MKSLLFAFALFATSLAAAGSVPSPAFEEKTLQLPPLTLENLALANRTRSLSTPEKNPSADRFGHGFSTVTKSAQAPSRVSNLDNLPILRPNPAVDYKLIVKTVDPKIDEKMLVPRSGETDLVGR